MFNVTKQHLTRSLLGMTILGVGSVGIAAPVYDFNDGTNQGWTVEIYQSTAGVGGLLVDSAAANWDDNANYSGNPALGRPPVPGPLDPLDSNGSLAIPLSGTSDLLAHDYIIASFASPSFVGEALESIEAYFITGAPETGLLEPHGVHAQVWYKKESSPSFFLGYFFTLDTSPYGGISGYESFWTRAVADVAPGDLVTQIGVDIWQNTDGNIFTPHLDMVSTIADGSGNGNQPIPEPGTLVLVSLGLFSLGFARLQRNTTH